MKKQDKKMTSWQAMKQLLPIIGRYRLLLFISIILAAVSVIFQLYVPIIFGRAIDQIVGPGKVDFPAIGQDLVQILILVIVSAAATWLMGLINNKLTYRTVQDIREKAIRQLQLLPLSYLDQHSSGDIVSRIIADTDQLSDGLLLGFSQLFSGLITIVATLAFMLSQSVEITLLVLVLTPLSFIVARFIASRSYQMFRKQSQTRGEQTSLIEEMVSGVNVVKAFGYEKTASSRFAEINHRLQEYSQQATFYSSLTNPATRFINSLIYALVALAGAFAIMGGRLTVGGLSVLLNYSNQYMKPFNDISSVITELQNAAACAGRVFELINEEPEADPVDLNKADGDLPEVKTGSVVFDHVNFSYQADKPLIRDFNLTAKPGMRVALVGPTGCGKTTTINLLMRFYDVDSGGIYLGGRNIKDMSRHALRKKFGMVLQDTWLEEGTVRDNLAYGKEDATDEEIIAAAKAAHSWGFIRRLPQGLDTPLSADSLSAGQKQLLCITRVMLLDPPMLILDEATSSIDTRTEMLIQAAFDKLMQGRTSFVVAHRLSTVVNADLILVMKDGQIIERGKHADLLARGGFYSQLYRSQFAKFPS
ncbi:sugar ABC transporter ATP-binding protein [Lactobacillus delbrueckii subsp. delbrueckii DSM 20074 = JCM 1012]|uniref:ABC transporter ATP-binding protein n=1 Tax=Lactobacillus delbrueckii TaxID=1584 RepID=UPI00069C3CE4|nr:ABC transporter ATP-binding protein [Lactobacillus delbrueckii]APP09856.1 sugar ABC transporter ATP-binding protein [Lactobacillus delbrueckii subsp. delbrueckii DSM 20074 = JCM 1012]KNZ38018.1 sugar ABC transporter ATP-binding protein [Lactobacillus delbrueckii subsp. delbrueckii]KRK27230.1 sugar ABC transporter ATP-binding protein [Lactobacillus delbrueckii subsp. delbrueckii DSM 20074 = JCM 1012]MCT3492922.1 ABC transporter ATP-binding protein [Lactobacillus delbrueckii]MCT3521899.1 ABC 